MWSPGNGAKPSWLKTGRGRAGWWRRKRSLRRAGWLHPHCRRKRSPPPIRSCTQNSLRHLQGLHADLAAGVVSQYPAGATDSPFKTLGDMVAQARSNREACPSAMPDRNIDASGRRVVEKSRQDRSQCDSPIRVARPRSTTCWAGKFRCPSTTARNRSDSSKPAPVRAPRRHDRLAGIVSANVPSMAEAVPGYDTEVWWGLLGPAGMPARPDRETLA